jgi:hypothetical protein
MTALMILFLVVMAEAECPEVWCDPYRCHRRRLVHPPEASRDRRPAGVLLAVH